MTLTKMYWLLGQKLKLTLHKQQHSHIQGNTPTNLDLWNRASTSSIGVLKHFQFKVLHMTVDTPWYGLNIVT
jgi:hypothetical protein